MFRSGSCLVDEETKLFHRILKNIYVAQRKSLVQVLCIIMEHCDGGDLDKVRRAALLLEESGKGRKSRKWIGGKVSSSGSLRRDMCMQIRTCLSLFKTSISRYVHRHENHLGVF